MILVNKSNTLAIVPARGGSKRFKKKNLYPILGKPMIQYSLDLLNILEDEVTPFISTDDKEILQYCTNKGFQMDYIRPSNLAEDDTSIIDVILDAVEWYESKNKISLKCVILLQPTSPDRSLNDISRGLSMFKKNLNKSVISVMPMIEPPEECLIINDDQSWSPMLGKVIENHNSQNFLNEY